MLSQEAACTDVADFTPKNDFGPPAAQLVPDSWHSPLVPISHVFGRAAEKAIGCHQSSLSEKPLGRFRPLG
jgi:hypothetical protein